ncbi:LNS2-domain-containing protein [Macrolepiota fuliginosa MF-IS2]|uniref:LNS2-domain-containing protein n=1 Tax=Macrolepiota fuliginosa MF-IS2 TaxID=1400762 RepID=A0A9P5XHT4_9AGAR|nr:LNS2-domain-containing protein [Macrolepiota fuliginosa MF-IS2]
MNYIRGAVNAISAPYQYYKELPPINPSTLTGAIDVIVIQRPGSGGDIELACSPFHVRFGKWQVLRPSDKNVNVSVNGQPIPYNMKIGEAGEAFFVFETDEDVPPDLITSPILQPTRPEEEAAVPQTDSSTDHFGGQAEPPSDEINAPEEIPGSITLPLNKTPEQGAQPKSQEPEFLDLDAGNGEVQREHGDEEPHRDINLTPKQQFHQPSFLPRSTSRSTIHQRQQSTEGPSKSALGLPSPPISRSPTPEMEEQDQRVDRALECLAGEVLAPEVEYHHDIALDMEGYHSHGKETSDQTIRSSDSELFKFPSLHRRSSRTLLSTPPLPKSKSTHNTSPSDSDSDSESNEPPSSFSHPRRPERLRATSEPPPDLDDHFIPPSDAEFIYDNSELTPSQSRTKSTHGLQIPPLSSPSGIQEYSWEWGAFPTPSPMKTSFGKGFAWKGKARDLDDLLQETLDEDWLFSGCGRLSAKSGEDTTIFLTVGQKSVSFELSLISQSPPTTRVSRKGKEKENAANELPLLDGYDEISRRFEEGKLTLSGFMQDESPATNPSLTIKWIDGHYATRQDNPSLLDALGLWRIDTLKAQGKREQTPEEEESTNEIRHARSKSEPPTPEQKAMTEAEGVENETTPGKKPASSSWVQWWSRSRRRETEISRSPATVTLRPAVSEPPPIGTVTTEVPTHPLSLDDQGLKLLSAQKPGNRASGTAPALPSTPSQISLTDETTRPIAEVRPTVAERREPQLPRKKFAKTLRLTSDQLKTLDLKPGANSITFSISSGVIACTARIFVWEHSDLVVISDIDGTITKSDGLGHVFAMIGRDWTHVGVAKLYTDIVRNGYKIMYLTSRAIGQADATRGYLKGIKQNDYQLPEGPVIMSPDRLMASLHREVIMRKPELFKMACLRDIQRLFGEHAKNPFYAGFGNRITDALSYRSVNVPSARIFTIDSTGEVKMELLELAGYKSSYIHMTDLVDQMFPPIHKKWAPEYTDFNYWKIPVPDYPLPDLTPPSPTLSARSDTSNQSRLAKLRNFRLMSSRANSISGIPNEVVNENSSRHGNGSNSELNRDPELRQMSSFGKLVSGLRRSVSPGAASTSSYAADSDSESDVEQGPGRRSRRRSMTSMPGSLDDIHFGMEDDEEEVHWEGNAGGEHADEEAYKDEDAEYDDEVYDGEVDEEMAIDEDLWAATEMKKIPFL